MKTDKREPGLRIWFNPVSEEKTIFYHPVDSPEEAKKILASIFRYHVFLKREGFFINPANDRYHCRQGLEVEEVITGAEDEEPTWVEWESEDGQSITDYEPPEKIDSKGLGETLKDAAEVLFGDFSLLGHAVSNSSEITAKRIKKKIILEIVSNSELESLTANDLFEIGELAERIINEELNGPKITLEKSEIPPWFKPGQ